ncbi:nucleotidyltransferase family protein [Natronorubrum aibiense]|uniref:NTP transferase domain-containing protein n=1 Tax=Natronorubrum aibiense TaxID=348826 RepID=A0A5P9P601_9EURY|nr:nucleotidyltransferase family protein [Natronorubrum aibiense]QFU83230.1 NTP transferase domain-containing protein [Natronorubrum aibiense]
MTADAGDEETTRSATADLPVVDLDDPVSDLESVDRAGRTDAPRVAGVVLAAGTSSRFGADNKLLATVDDEPVVRRATRTLLESSVDPVVVVLGHQADRVRAALEGLPVETHLNEAYETGQASSLRTGIRAVRDHGDCDAAVVALGDMPFVDPETVETLVAAYAANVGEAIAAAFDGERGNPVLFDARFFDVLTDVDGDIGGREIFLESDSSVLVAVDDPGVRRDVDVPADL